MYHNDLALRVGISKATLVPLAARLLSASLVSLDYDMPDRRRTQLRVTGFGETLLRRLEARLDLFEQEFFSVLGQR